MLRFSLRVARKEKIRHKYISGTAKVRCFGDKIREARFKWCGDLDKWDKRFQEGRREDGYKKKKKIWLFNVPNKNFYSVIFSSSQFKSTSHVCIMLFYCRGNHGAV